MAAKRGRLGCAAAAGLAAAALLIVGWGLERQFLYFPTRVLESTPEAHGLAAEELDLRAEDGVRLRGWRLRGPARPLADPRRAPRARRVPRRLPRVRTLGGRTVGGRPVSRCARGLRRRAAARIRSSPDRALRRVAR